jgi:transposase
MSLVLLLAQRYQKTLREHSNGLWVIEQAYRITKGTLKMRPMFHFIPKRIESHVCICFVAYNVYKELEWILKLSKINLSKDDNHIKNQITRRWQLNNQNNVAYTKPSINRDAF